MFDTVPIKASEKEFDDLRRRYRLWGKTNQEVAEFVWERLLRDPHFHLSKNRTDSDK